MELHQLRYFVAVAEAGSMTLAARRCHVAQPSLSQQIRKLEETLGVTLFDRLGRGVVMTDAGRALLPRARRILAEVRETGENLRAEVSQGGGRLVIGAIPTIAPYLLPPVLASLRAEAPGSELVVREDLTERLVEAVVDNELDVAITSTPIDHGLVEVQAIGSEPLLVVVPSSHPLAGGERMRLSDLRAQPSVTLSDMHCLGKQIGSFCARAGVTPEVICRATQLATVLELVRLSMGMALVPAMVAACDEAPGRAYLRLARPQPSREIALLWRVGRSRPALGEPFVRLATGHLRALIERTSG